MRLTCGTPFVAAALVLAAAGSVNAQPSCSAPGTFSETSTVKKLLRDCITDTTIFIPAGKTLNGNGNTITAVDPSGGPFVGAVVQNAGSTANVNNLTIDTANLANVCHEGVDRLRGILFDGASGSITNNTVLHINQGASGCQEGNGIEVRNFDSPGVKSVTISGNQVHAYQKTGIVANGEVSAAISKNNVGGSATQANLAANGIQVGFGAIAKVDGNIVEGNTWLGFDAETSDFAATAILLFEAGPLTKILNNRINQIGGNADVGIYVGSDLTTVTGNRVYDIGPDVDGPDMDTGIANPGDENEGVDNNFSKNKVRCYQTPYDNVSGSSNTVLPCLDPTATTSVAAASARRGTASPFDR